MHELALDNIYIVHLISYFPWVVIKKYENESYVDAISIMFSSKNRFTREKSIKQNACDSSQYLLTQDNILFIKVKNVVQWSAGCYVNNLIFKSSLRKEKWKSGLVQSRVRFSVSNISVPEHQGSWHTSKQYWVSVKTWEARHGSDARKTNAPVRQLPRVFPRWVLDMSVGTDSGELPISSTKETPVRKTCEINFSLG